MSFHCSSLRSSTCSALLRLVIGSALALGGGRGRWDLPLQASPLLRRLHPFQVPPETDRFYLTSHLRAAAPLSATHTHRYINIQYIYVHSAQINCQHGPTESAAPPTVSSESFKRAMDQLPTADKAVFVIFSLFSFLSHTTGDQESLWVLFLFGNLKWQRGQRWICDITVCRLNLQVTVRGERQLEAGTPVEAILALSGQANSCGWWLGGK